jgi:hypothetical protein
VAWFELYISGMENRCETIKAIEVVRVRLFDMNNGSKVVGIFQREAGLSQHPLQATLFQSPLIPNDWSICFWRSSSAEYGSKSPGGVRCAEALRSIGLVDHTVWQQTTNGKSPANPHQGLVARASI